MTYYLLIAWAVFVVGFVVGWCFCAGCVRTLTPRDPATDDLINRRR